MAGGLTSCCQCCSAVCQVPLTVILEDVNDMAPEFSRLSGYAISVSEDLPVKSLITAEVHSAALQKYVSICSMLYTSLG